MSANKRYLGDGVYVDLENRMLKVTTEDGLRTTNIVWMEPEVYDSLVEYVDMLRAENIEWRTP